jgi:hypothetical protein
MADLIKHRTSLVKGVLGHNPPPQKLVLRGMTDLEKALTQEFRERDQRRARLADVNAPLRDKLLAALGKDDPAWAAYVRKRRGSRELKPSARVTLPKIRRQKDRVFLGSLGATRVPPFDYQWTWSAKTGSPELVFPYARADIGGLITQVVTGKRKASASARAAVGIFFQSPSECVSKFNFWANARLRFEWQTYSFLASSHSDGFIGLFAGSYDWAGNFNGTLVDQRISLWNDDAWWNGATDLDSSDGVSLAANFQVDPDHWYALWLWCGTHDSGDGDGTVSWGQAWSTLSIWAPSISWQVG